MIDIYTVFKKLIPKKIRAAFKPIYLKLALRSFKNPVFVKIKKYSFFIKIDRTNGAIDQYVYIHRNWDKKIGEIIERELEIGDTFIDIGANIGYFSLLASTLVGQNGQVISFEPIAKIAKQFTESITYNNFQNILVKNIALGDRKNTLQLSIVPGNIGGSSLVKKNTSGIYETVNVSTLDDELPSSKKIDLIKIDVEGYEYEVLLGAKNTLEKYKPKIILEFSPNVYNKRDSKIGQKILTFLRDLEYLIYDIERNVLIENIDQYLEQLGIEQTNLFAHTEKK